MDCIAGAIMNENGKPLEKLHDLQPLFEEFRERQSESTRHLPNSGNSKNNYAES